MKNFQVEITQQMRDLMPGDYAEIYLNDLIAVRLPLVSRRDFWLVFMDKFTTIIIDVLTGSACLVFDSARPDIKAAIKMIEVDRASAREYLKHDRIIKESYNEIV